MTDEDKIRYSPLEKKILAAIPDGGEKISTLDLVTKIYDRDTLPRNARQSFLVAANRLIEKSDDNEEVWELFKSKPRGSQPIYFWKEPRKRKEISYGFEKQE